MSLVDQRHAAGRPDLKLLVKASYTSGFSLRPHTLVAEGLIH